jgi:hypothetical protein
MSGPPSNCGWDVNFLKLMDHIVYMYLGNILVEEMRLRDILVVDWSLWNILINAEYIISAHNSTEYPGGRWTSLE